MSHVWFVAHVQFRCWVAVSPGTTNYFVGLITKGKDFTLNLQNTRTVMNIAQHSLVKFIRKVYHHLACIIIINRELK